MTAPVSDLRERVDGISWFHRIDLGQGIVTPGLDNTPDKEAQLELPSLQGKTVLDIGAWDGYFSFAAERLGASRVLATDSFVWSGATWGSKAGFDLARETLGSKVEERQIDVMDLSPEAVGTFDVVFFLGVLYHLRHPLLALERVASVTRELLVLETAVDMTFTRRPAAAFYPTDELDGDDSNWWGPNPPAVVGMLKAVGFSHVEIVNQRSVASKASHTLKMLPRLVQSRVERDRRSQGLGYLGVDRLIVHARR